MDFVTATNIIVQTTGRPERVNKIKAAINRNIELYTRMASWAADIVEESIAIDPATYIQELDIKTDFTDPFRKMYYMRPLWSEQSVKAAYLTFCTPDKILTPEGKEVTNTWYRAGNRIVLKLNQLAPSLYVGYYRSWPYLIADNDTHWMLDDAFSMIHDSVCAYVYTDVGNDAEGRKYEAYAQRSYLSAKTDLETGVDLLTQGA